MILRLVIIGLWLVSVPVGYVLARWVFRSVIPGKWTRNDRLFAITFSVLYGPLMPIFAVLFWLIWKLQDSKWGKTEVKW